ncbi:hypothetical protein Poli38472_011712 [Pythium oligandrum]|uniref:HTH psq-type domain-containing protein n=1 Tax=Pythium oligandrum TaxID=41045 RepID=A0A8K1FEN2_PYTOL|nr:hypothetical protein Poli38472_011712 [Pythium oligandrum]|eukprot:TMW58124.1 hypothetical protein Poli38472_011712 [Pythium oligandrum]
MTDSPASPSSYYPSYQCYTPPGSPAYGHFVSLSPTSSVESFTETWPSSEEEERTPQSYFQEMMYRPIAPEYLKPTPRNVPAKPKPRRVRKKYLKERQRCEILRRVRAGERQTHLAKEFGVSRAAVCYLLKHETEILRRSAARHQRALANWHPWK